MNQAEDGFKHILVVIDAFSLFTWLFATKSTGSKEVIKHLSSLFDTFGNPQNLVSDRGTPLRRKNSLSFYTVGILRTD